MTTFIFVFLLTVHVLHANGLQVPSSKSNKFQVRASPCSTHDAAPGDKQHKFEDEEPKFDKRRDFLKAITASSLLTFSTMNIGVENALASQTAGEAVRRTAANIPGYGQPDCYFPPSFIGKWRATRIVVASDDPYISQLPLPATITYDVRFITVDGDTKSDGSQKIVADRQFNEASFYNAIGAELGGKEGVRTPPPPALQTITWSPFNPNVCTSNYSDGSSKEIKVTKRAGELDAASGIISSSEYRRITTVSTGSFGGIPSISASRVLTKWKSEGVGKEQIVEGIEIVYTDGSLGGDPMAAGIGSSSSKPQMTSKSRLKLEKIED